jgi:hypothetical protein
MVAEVTLQDEGKSPYRALIRPGDAKDRARLTRSWGPVLERGPERWLDREWRWSELGSAELAFSRNPELLVLSDEIELGARGDLLGILVTTAPITPQEAALDAATVSGPLLWVEYIAIAPSLRTDCPAGDRRSPVLKGVGIRLMIAAIGRSRAMGLGGRVGLHAEGALACDTYVRWEMRQLEPAIHPAGGSYPVFLGDDAWANLPRWK